MKTPQFIANTTVRYWSSVQALALSLTCAVLVIGGTAHAAPIHDAAKAGDMEQLRAAIASGADVNASNGLATPLYYAVSGGHLAAAEFLIGQGADVNAASIWGAPIISAAASGKADLVALLTANGADANAEFQTETPLHLTARAGCLPCAKTLVAAGADVNALNIFREPPLHWAKARDHDDVTDFLLEAGTIIPKPEPITDKIASASAARGLEVFKRECAKCHFVEVERENKFGPNLSGVVGRQRASLESYEYSKTLKAWAGPWTADDLNVFLWGPTRTKPGTAMEIPGVTDDGARADLIAYLATLN